MSGGLQFDSETGRKVESLYLSPDVVAQRGRVLKALEPREGERVLDIGSGPGLLAYDMAASVGRDGRGMRYRYQRRHAHYVENTLRRSRTICRKG
jgi:arsenite methyltransferase